MTRSTSSWRSVLAILATGLLLSACSGGGGGSDDAASDSKPEATTSTTEEKATTTTEADDEDEDAPVSALPTDEDAAPSGDWISVRFLVATEPEPEDFNPGSGEARLWDVEPDCDDDDGCSLTLLGGGDDGSFAMPGAEPLTGEPLVMEPEGDEWTNTYEYPDAVGCTDELDGPYLDTTETRTLEPVYSDDVLTGMVGTTVFTDTLTSDGIDAGCPASAAGTYAYVVVAAPNDQFEEIDAYEVDAFFRQTLEVTDAVNQPNPLFQPGGLSTTFEKYDVALTGSCEDGGCDVEFAQINGDGDLRNMFMNSEDGLGLNGTYEELGGCSNPDTGEMVFDTGAYESVGTYEDLTPVWIEDGQVKAMIGWYTHSATPTELGATDPSCSEPESLEGWVYLVDREILDV